MEIKEIRKKQRWLDGTFFTRKEYACGERYEVAVTTTEHKNGYKSTSIHINNGNAKYLPEIYYYDDDQQQMFKIQTTAYGALDPEEISEVLEGYEEALEVVKTLTERFIKNA